MSPERSTSQSARSRLRPGSAGWLAILVLLGTQGGCSLFRFPALSGQDHREYYSLRCVADEKELKEYLSLRSEQRAEWLRQFWKRRDPTPTTDVNEFKDEHDRRVAFAREHFGAGAVGAPWDDRGEVYIKYGEPLSRQIETDREEWQYDRLDLYFVFIDKHLSGHFELAAGGQSLQDFSIAQAKLVEMVREHYQLDYGGKPLPVALNTGRFKEEPGKVRLDIYYSLPLDRLRQLEASGFGDTILERRLALFNADWEEVARDTVFLVSIWDSVSWSVDDSRILVGTVSFTADPGAYTLALEMRKPGGKTVSVVKKNLVLVGYLPGAQEISDLVVGWTPSPSGGQERYPAETPPYIVPNPEGAFGSADSLWFYYEVYNLRSVPGGERRYAARCRVLGRRGAVVASVPDRVFSVYSADAVGTSSVSLPDLPDGEYVLELKVKDLAAGRSRTALAPFSVRKPPPRVHEFVAEKDLVEHLISRPETTGKKGGGND